MTDIKLDGLIGAFISNASTLTAAGSHFQIVIAR